MGVTGFAFGRGAENGRYVVIAFYIRLGGEIQVATIRLRFTRKRFFEIAFCLAAFE